ncbi:MAG: universal stress protein [Planctomycetes bacterium]|nr:universal stress protein [Planctomycetota bacterium]
MFTIQRILVPTDFSELSRHAALHARSLAETHRAALHVVHVIPSDWEPTLVPEVGTIMPAEQVRDRAKKLLDTFISNSLAGLDSPITTSVLSGTEAGEISRYASEEAIDVIVVGTHARGLVKRIFRGSISKAVLEKAPCPVLMVPIVIAHGHGGAEGVKTCLPAGTANCG